MDSDGGTDSPAYLRSSMNSQYMARRSTICDVQHDPIEVAVIRETTHQLLVRTFTLHAKNSSTIVDIILCRNCRCQGSQREKVQISLTTIAGSGGRNSRDVRQGVETAISATYQSQTLLSESNA